MIDADVLGRRRTGDETYVAGLLGALADGRTRTTSASRRSRGRPDLVPEGIEPVELQARSQVTRMAVTLPRLLRRLRPARRRTSSTPSRAASRAGPS